ncbi:ABC transporter [Penicillium hordei]|uniref:ABC transporter n=1 Tax=Penicillium hordei TaxID=40994 RepID=A0AAD6GYX3_9EURO|nr:ABC transporter [Penicillium hordei]KAJ5593639.1 ABC transporter [Penicillium hordei]
MDFLNSGLGMSSLYTAAAFPGQFFIKRLGALVAYFVLRLCSSVVVKATNHKYRKQIVNDMLGQDLRFFDRPENPTSALTSRTDFFL